jgi:hypothetical protein
MTTSGPAAPHRDSILTRARSVNQEPAMKKTVLTFGLIADIIMSVLMDGNVLLADKIGSGHSLVIGYTILVASFLLIYFGIRSYRDNTLAGQISFGRAFACGILITLITTVCYVATWEILYFKFIPHFMDSYFAAQIHKVQSSGLDAATTAAGRCHRALSAALPKSVGEHGLHLHGAPARRPDHYSPLRCHPPPQSPCGTHRRFRSHAPINQRLKANTPPFRSTDTREIPRAAGLISPSYSS